MSDLERELRPGSSMCLCPTCQRYFSRTSTFDQHRIGPYDGDRRCMTVTEMTTKGMVNRDGVWGNPGPAVSHWTKTAEVTE